MNETLRFLNSFVNSQLLTLSLEELSNLYKISETTEILATAYNKIFKLAIVINNDYWGLDEVDLASYCLEKLHFCLKTFDGRNKFTTYFSVVYKNKLREETEKLNYKKRKCVLESINDIIEIGVEDTYNLLELMLPKNLTRREHEVCILKSEGYDNTYCSQKLGVSRMTICNIEKSLKIKLSVLQDL